MTQTEALKLALEALEYASSRIEKVDFDFEPEITAIKEALEQQEGQSNCCLQCEALSRELAASKAQLEQEPVGEAYLCDSCHTPFDGAFQCPSCGHGRATREPVYTTPAQRKPLTDEQIEPIAIDVLGYGALRKQDMELFTQSVRAIEAAHGIKGDA